MAENIFASFDISSQGMSVQRKRLSAVANNIANVNTTKGADGKPYQRETVIVHGTSQNLFELELNGQINLQGSRLSHGSNLNSGNYPPDNFVLNSYIAKDNTPSRLLHDPSHPDAREDGYVEVPNINIVTEMVEMMTAQRAFEANSQVVESAKNFAKASLEI
jgi:flagellar basal-body rod protein FlgC